RRLGGARRAEGRRTDHRRRRHARPPGRTGQGLADEAEAGSRRQGHGSGGHGGETMISKFFIDRPVFASVISIIIVIGGLLAMRILPISQYPEIIPPEVSVSATYPGASAETIAATVAAPLEQQINGVEKMLYMRSTSTGSGTLNLTVTFQIGTNPDQATINVNNRVQRATPLLPSEVQRQGVVVQKRSSSILEVIAMASPNRTYN